MDLNAKNVADTLRKMANIKQMLVFPYDTGKIINESADLIESLAAELEQVKQERDGLNILLGQAQSMLETRTRERDAAVEEWKQSAIAGKSMCDTCMFSDDEGRCWNDCIDGELWQWRGVKEG